VTAQDVREAARVMNSFAIHLLRAMGRVDAESGLTPARLSALSVLHFGGPRSLGRLAGEEGVSSPTMSRVVDALCEQGLAERRTHDDNGRVTLVAATSAGSDLMRRAADRRAEVIAEALAALPLRQRERLVRVAAHLPDLVNAVREASRAPAPRLSSTG
jgi:DNA-binding MarR family transcriptional regulator